jgi:hypothetical protein
VTIEVSEAGFNPSLCLLSRGDQVFFKNVGGAPRNIVGIFSNDDHFYDSGEIPPGAVSMVGFSGFDFPNRWQFSDTHNSLIHGVAITPVNSNSQDPSCTPDPALRPAPCLHAGALAANG